MRVFDSTKVMHFLVHPFRLPKNMRKGVLQFHEGYECAQSKHETTSPSLFAVSLSCQALELPVYIEFDVKGGYNYIKNSNNSPNVRIMHNSENIAFNNCAIRRYDTSSDAVQASSDKQMEYVSQFLQVEQISPKNELFPKNNNQIATVSAVNPAQCPAQEQPNCETSDENKKVKSIFHNFQKHLVTTLKMHISISKLNTKNDPTVYLAQSMWKIFQQSHYFSKKILHFLFGVSCSNRRSKTCKNTSGIFEGFTQIASIYPVYEIQLAQEYLRQQVVRQGRRLLSKNLLSHRRMQKGEEFESYFSKFLEEIDNGPMSRRLPKSSKLRLLGCLAANKQQNE